MSRSFSTEGWSEGQPGSLPSTADPGTGERVFVQPIPREIAKNGHRQSSTIVWPASQDLVPEQANERKEAEKHDPRNEQRSSI